MPRVVPYPFPGMDPWMQTMWGDTHATLAGAARTRLNEVLPDDLRAVTEETVVLTSERRKTVRPDNAVLRQEPATFGEDGGGGTAVAAPPATATFERISLADDPETQYSLRIEEPAAGRVVTVIEWVSPTNKNDDGAREQYREKRSAWWGRRVNTVDIDLTRGSAVRRDELLRPVVPRGGPLPDYFVGVWVAERPMEARGYRASLRERLPVIEVPLREGEAAVPLDLQALTETAWRTGRWWLADHYAPCEPPLPADDAAWAARRLAEWRQNVELSG